MSQSVSRWYSGSWAHSDTLQARNSCPQVGPPAEEPASLSEVCVFPPSSGSQRQPGEGSWPRRRAVQRSLPTLGSLVDFVWA